VRRALSTLVLVVVGALSQSACCEIQKAPGRCVACCYDSCIIPAVGTGSAALPSTISVDDQVGRSAPRAMAY